MTGTNFTGIDIPCPICHHTAHTVVGDTDRHGDPLRTVLCRGCGHVYTNPQPTSQELLAFYGERYRTSYKGVTTPKMKHVYRAGLRALERFEQLKMRVPPGARILDIGSGGGEFVYLLTKAGFKAQGIEPNQGYAAFSSSVYGIDVKIGGVEDSLIDSDAYSAVTLHHVLEHLAAPVTTLKAIGDTLSERGFVVVEVPNSEARYHGPRRQFHFAHLHNFSEESLRLAGTRADLTTSHLTLQPHTRHISVVFEKGLGDTQDAPDSNSAERVAASLRTYTKTRDVLSSRPYRRLWANIKRPVRERLALKRLGNPTNARDLLDRLYDPVLSRASP